MEDFIAHEYREYQEHKGEDEGERDPNISRDKDDTGLNAALMFVLREALWSPEHILKRHPKGMTDEEKTTGRAYYPPDLVIQDLWNNNRELYDELKKNMFNHPKCTDIIDYFAMGLYTKLKDGVDSYEPESFVSYKEALDSPNSHKRSLQLERFGDTRFFVPKFTEEVNGSRLNISGYKSQKVADFMLHGLNEMKLFDFMPTYFTSDEEAAVYFEYTVRQFLPEGAFADKVNVLCRDKQLHADVSAICFSGIGQWYMNAIKWTDGKPMWHNLQAKEICLAKVPKDAVVVVDVCMAAKYEAREGYERYGAAVFFNAKREAIAVWIDHEEEMVRPPSAGAERLSPAARDWEFALWRFRVSVFFQGFAVGHLVTVHWGMSNSLVVGTRESLDPHHPLRELITPYLYGAITINKAAIVNLGSERGAIVRIGALAMGDGPGNLISDLANEFRYETFPDFLKSKGQFPEGMLESMPMVQDGLLLYGEIEKFVANYLSLFYDDESNTSNFAKYVTDDADVVAFWAKCRETSGNMVDLPDLNFKNLVGYITTCIFYFTAVHEMLGNVNFMTMMPRCLSGRIHKREHFGNNPFQASIQDWYRIICVVTSTTLNSVPMLIPQQYRSASYFYKKSAIDADNVVSALGKMDVPDLEGPVENGKPYKTPRNEALAVCYQSYGDALIRVSKEVEAANDTRHLTFGSFNPKRMEISVSL